MKYQKTKAHITAYISRPGTQFGGHAYDQRVARVPVFFEGGIPVVAEIIKVEKDYYYRVDTNPLRYLLMTFSKAELVDDLGGKNGAHHTGRNKRRN